MAIISAEKLSRALDRDVSDWTVESLHQAFVENGCAVVRGGIPHPILNDVRDVIATAYTKTTDVHVYDKDIQDVSNGRLTGYELVDTPLLQAFLDRVYEGQDWRRAYVAARRIQGVDANHDWQQPLDLHLDSQFHGFNFTTNFWIPFQNCGVDSPSLQLVPLGYLQTRQYAGFTGSPLRDGAEWFFGYFPEGVLEPAAIEKEFGDQCFFRPVMRPGDVIIASNWIIHGSYRTPEMKKGRTSVEVRFTGSNSDIRK